MSSGDDQLDPDYEELQDCPIDENGDTEDPNNLFSCKASEECCTLDLSPACCAKKELKDELMDQLELWGPLLAVIIVLSLLIWWCRSDDSCCDVDKPWLVRCGCKKKPTEDDEESMTSSQLSLRSNKSGTTLLVNDDVTGHDASELELAAENLEQTLEEDGSPEEPPDEPAEKEEDGGDEKEEEEEAPEENDEEKPEENDEEKPEENDEEPPTEGEDEYF